MNVLHRLSRDAAGNTLPAHKIFHRALLALIPAVTFTLAGWQSGFAWYFLVPAALFGAAGAWLLKCGADAWDAQSAQRHRPDRQR